MARIFVTGSTEGLGRAAAETLIKLGHQVKRTPAIPIGPGVWSNQLDWELRS